MIVRSLRSVSLCFALKLNINPITIYYLNLGRQWYIKKGIILITESQELIFNLMMTTLIIILNLKVSDRNKVI